MTKHAHAPLTEISEADVMKCVGPTQEQVTVGSLLLQLAMIQQQVEKLTKSNEALFDVLAAQRLETRQLKYASTLLVADTTKLRADNERNKVLIGDLIEGIHWRLGQAGEN